MRTDKQKGVHKHQQAAEQVTQQEIVMENVR